MLDAILFIGLIISGFMSIVSFGVLYGETTMAAKEIYGYVHSFIMFGILIGLAIAAIDRHYKKH